jgi:hypothetical protein
MKIHFLFIAWLGLLVITTFRVGIETTIFMGNDESHQRYLNYQESVTLTLESTPTPDLSEQDSFEDLPIAHNPGLVLGAIILVLIIVGGVFINSKYVKKK